MIVNMGVDESLLNKVLDKVERISVVQPRPGDLVIFMIDDGPETIERLQRGLTACLGEWAAQAGVKLVAMARCDVAVVHPEESAT